MPPVPTNKMSFFFGALLDKKSREVWNDNALAKSKFEGDEKQKKDEAKKRKQREEERAQARAEYEDRGDTNEFVVALHKKQKSELVSQCRRQAAQDAEDVAVGRRTLDAVIILGPAGVVPAGAPTEEPTDTAAATVDSAARRRGTYVKWNAHRAAKQQARAALKKYRGDASAALKHLQSDSVLNASGIFDSLKVRTLQSWGVPIDEEYWDDPTRKRKHGGHMASPVLHDTKVEMIKLLGALGAAGASLNSSTIRPQWIALVKERQPGTMKDEGGTFGMCPDWINKVCSANHYTMQRKTTKSNHLPENWEEVR